jgi:hypothetical protein
MDVPPLMLLVLQPPNVLQVNAILLLGLVKKLLSLVTMVMLVLMTPVTQPLAVRIHLRSVLQQTSVLQVLVLVEIVSQLLSNVMIILLVQKILVTQLLAVSIPLITHIVPPLILA